MAQFLPRIPPFPRFWSHPAPYGPIHPPMPPPQVHPLFVEEKEEPFVPFIPPDLEGLAETESPDEEDHVRGGHHFDRDDEERYEEKERERSAPKPPPEVIIQKAPSSVQVHPQLPPQQLIPLKVYKYRSSKDEWKHSFLSGVRPVGRPHEPPPRSKPPCSKLRIITWNVDLQNHRQQDRLFAALRHMEEDVLKCKNGGAPEPCVILLQEVHRQVLPFLLHDPWVRRWFAVTPFTTEKWPRETTYGNVTLVSRSVDVFDAHILHYGCTAMHRTAVCVKVRLNFGGSHEKAVLSIVNTHLESLPMGASARPKQLELCARFLRMRDVDGGLIAGDMNAIGPGDSIIGQDLGLRDSWKKDNDDKRGMTWGFQEPDGGGRYPPNRLDKIFYLPGRGYKLDEPTLIGVGLKIGEGKDALWVSDHFGLFTTLHMKRGSKFA